LDARGSARLVSSRLVSSCRGALNRPADRITFSLKYKRLRKKNEGDDGLYIEFRSSRSCDRLADNDKKKREKKKIGRKKEGRKEGTIKSRGSSCAGIYINRGLFADKGRLCSQKRSGRPSRDGFDNGPTIRRHRPGGWGGREEAFFSPRFTGPPLRVCFVF